VYKENPADVDRYNVKPLFANTTVRDSLTDKHAPATINFWYQIR
jgi:hypothetical protein